MTMQAYPKEGGDAPIVYGQEVTDFRGDKAFFLRVTREPHGSSEGKVMTIRPSKKWPEDQEVTLEALLEDHDKGYPENTGSWCQELYPSVYDLVIR